MKSWPFPEPLPPHAVTNPLHAIVVVVVLVVVVLVVVLVGTGGSQGPQKPGTALHDVVPLAKTLLL
jgi:hypothetical protein